MIDKWDYKLGPRDFWHVTYNGHVTFDGAIFDWLHTYPRGCTDRSDLLVRLMLKYRKLWTGPVGPWISAILLFCSVRPISVIFNQDTNKYHIIKTVNPHFNFPEWVGTQTPTHQWRVVHWNWKWMIREKLKNLKRRKKRNPKIVLEVHPQKWEKDWTKSTRNQITDSPKISRPM